MLLPGLPGFSSKSRAADYDKNEAGGKPEKEEH